jgi:HPt (histidine-containing phosphotransfer) domain-containing protein
MTTSSERPSPEQLAEQQVAAILRAAHSWSGDAPTALEPAIRAVCVRLAEMVADQRHYLAPLPEPQESERKAVLNLVAGRLRSAPVTTGIEANLKGLEELELRATGSWAIVATAQTDWVTTAGVIASVRALIGVDELHARTESQFLGQPRKEPLPDA